MELETERLLQTFGVKYRRDDHESGLDFYLSDLDIYIEVKQFHSDRIARQMSRRKNVIAIQGMQSLKFLEALAKSVLESCVTSGYAEFQK